MMRMTGFRRRGISLVEVLIACAIMAAALVPIMGIISNSHRQIAAEKAEATAASWATTKLQEAVYTLPFGEVNSGSGEEVIDGTTIRWTLDVTEVPFSLTYQPVRYHTPCGGGGEGGSVELGDLQSAVPAGEIDRKFGGSVLKTLVLNVDWRPFSQGWDGDDPSKHVVLVTRKARLE